MELGRRSPQGTAAHRWSQALSGLTAGARAALDGALLAQRARRPGIPLGEEVNLATMVLQGTACYEGVSLLLVSYIKFSTVLTGFFYRKFFLQFSHEFSTENIFYRKFLSIFILDSSRFYSTVSVHVPIYGP
jgi:hypothetical protein